MEQSQANSEQRPSVVLRVNPADLTPTEAQIGKWKAALEGQRQARLAYTLGALTAGLEGAVEAIEQADGQWLTYHLQAGCVAIAAYEQTMADEQATSAE